MNRPSHWILALFAVIGPALWVWGLSEGFAEQRDPTRAPSQPVAVRLRNTPPALPVPQASLTGRVIDDQGAAIDQARVRVLGGRGAAVTRQGTFEVPIQLTEPYLRLEVSADGFAPTVARCASEDIESLVVCLTRQVPFAPTPSIPMATRKPALVGHGFVFDTERRPVPGANVIVLETGDSAFTDAGGSYRLPIPPERATLAVWHHDGRAVQTETFTYAYPEGMVALGETKLSPGARVQGAVRMPDGSPAVGAAVVLRHQGLERRVVTDAAGTFAVAGLIAVDYEFEVLPVPGCAGLRRTLQVSGSGRLPSELQLEAEKPVRVRVVDEEGVARSQAFVVAADEDRRRTWAQADAQGFATLRGLGAGEVTWIEVRSAQHAPLELVRVATGGGVPHLVTRL